MSPRRVLDGEALLAAFKKEHGIKSTDLARALMFIETFIPTCPRCGRPRGDGLHWETDCPHGVILPVQGP